MGDLVKEWCLICGEQLSEESAAEEHVIPNAIGGRIKTKKATCISCNVRSGHQLDAPFCKKLAPIANMIDIERERGENPELKFKDAYSGLQVKLTSGGNPEFDVNYRMNRKDSILNFMLTSTSNEDDARRILKRDHPKLNVGHLQPNKLDLTPKFSFVTPGYELVADLRSVAKMMLCYARYVGIHVSKTCSMVQFLRGEIDVNPNIAAPQNDVLRFEGSNVNYCGHSVSILYSPGADFIYCYLDLFSIIDYVGVIFIDEPATSRLYTHRHDLINGGLDSKELEWSVDSQDVIGWMKTREDPSSRLMKRMEVLQYWVPRKLEIWMRRAIIKGSVSFGKAIAKGVDPVEAKNAAFALINKYMEDHGCEIDLTNLNLELIHDS